MRLPGACLQLMRIRQWVKNVFVFLPLFFSKSLYEAEPLLSTILAAVSFSFLASTVYIINDIADRKSDALHPTKKGRPIAAGLLSVKQALLLGGLCLLLAIVPTFFLPLQVAYVLIAYLVLNIGYSFWFKHLSLVDLFVIAAGYLLRVFAGGLASDVLPSEWLILMTLLMALFLGLAKRREDVILFETEGTKARKTVDGYNLPFLNTAMAMMAGVLIVAYAMYIMSPETHVHFNSDYLYLTIIPVIAGVLRYLQISIVEENAGSPTELLLRDPFISVVVVLWGLLIMWFLY